MSKSVSLSVHLGSIVEKEGPSQFNFNTVLKSVPVIIRQNGRTCIPGLPRTSSQFSRAQISIFTANFLKDTFNLAKFLKDTLQHHSELIPMYVKICINSHVCGVTKV